MYELGVRAIIKDNFGAILLVKNAHGLHANKWVLPGGRVESNELQLMQSSEKCMKSSV
jgi:ADP-ribose pyrophosphatase YjhB (NUDIX family)